MVELITTLPYARAEGGTAQPFFEGAGWKQRASSHLLTLIVCLPFGPIGLTLLAVGWLLSKGIGFCYMRRFGGVTGDLLGSTNEILEVILLMACASRADLIGSYAGWTWI